MAGGGAVVAAVLRLAPGPGWRRLGCGRRRHLAQAGGALTVAAASAQAVAPWSRPPPVRGAWRRSWLPSARRLAALWSWPPPVRGARHGSAAPWPWPPPARRLVAPPPWPLPVCGAWHGTAAPWPWPPSARSAWLRLAAPWSRPPPVRGARHGSAAPQSWPSDAQRLAQTGGALALAAVGAQRLAQVGGAAAMSTAVPARRSALGAGRWRRRRVHRRGRPTLGTWRRLAAPWPWPPSARGTWRRLAAPWPWPPSARGTWHRLAAPWSWPPSARGTWRRLAAPWSWPPSARGTWRRRLRQVCAAPLSTPKPTPPASQPCAKSRQRCQPCPQWRRRLCQCKVCVTVCCAAGRAHRRHRMCHRRHSLRPPILAMSRCYYFILDFYKKNTHKYL